MSAKTYILKKASEIDDKSLPTEITFINPKDSGSLVFFGKDITKITSESQTSIKLVNKKLRVEYERRMLLCS